MATDDQRSGLRAADADREAVAQLLQEAGAAGRLDPEELDERLGRAYAGRTYADLEPLLADLPDAAPPWVGAAVAVAGSAGAPLVLTAATTDEKRGGAWRVPRSIVARPQMAAVKLDFREADCPHPRVDLEVIGGVGSVLLVLPDGWSVDASGLRTGWGTRKNRHEAPAARGLPTIVVTGGIGMGTLSTRGPRFWQR